MNVDIFVQIADLKGNSQDQAHKDWSDALAFALGVQVPPPTFSGGSLASKPSFTDFVIAKMLDRATAGLFNAAVTGKSLPKVAIDVCRLGVNKLCFLQYELDDVLVSTIAPGVTEQVALNYTKITQTFTPLKADGTPGTPVSSKVDLKTLGTVSGGGGVGGGGGGSGFSVGDGLELFARVIGIEGSSTAKGHEKWMELSSLSGGAVTVPIVQIGGGAAAGKTEISVVSMVKSVDVASPRLFEHAAMGKLTTVEIDICRSAAGDTPACDIQYTLDDALITQVVTEVSTVGVQESVAVTFGKITLTLTFRDATGKVVETQTFKLDLTAGKI